MSPQKQTPARKPAAAPANPVHAEEVEAGKSARKRVPRSALGAWSPAPDRADPVALLQAQEADRVADLVPIRYERMSASAFAFYRGSAAIMAADLGSREHTDLTVQLCGDAHLANFGGFATPDRTLVFDLNDFDETLPGPFEWDVQRLVASFEIAARHRNFSAKQCRDLVELVAKAYVVAVGELAKKGLLDVWYTRLSAADILDRWGSSADAEQIDRFHKLIAKGLAKTSARAISRYTEVGPDGDLHVLDQPPLLVPAESLPQSMLPGGANFSIKTWLGNALEDYGASLSADREHLLAGYRVIDAARKVVGVGSVGTRCWIALMTAKDDARDDLVLQFKQAGPSVYESVLPASTFDNHGRRVVEGQRLVQAASDVLLGWTRLATASGEEVDFYVRQMWDWKTSADLDTMELQAFRIYAQICGWTLARAHCRSGQRKALAAYLGSGSVFIKSMIEFASSYADQNEKDYQLLLAAIASGRVDAGTLAPRSDVDL